MSSDKLQQRFSTFVGWIATESSTIDEIQRQAKDVRGAIKAQAAEDGLVIRSTPDSGSFAKDTGLRRHLRGKSVVEGQDIDLPFVVAPKTKDDERLDSLLPRFKKYALAAYPRTKQDPSNSSVKLKFTNTLNYDLVPCLATSDAQRQILIRADGERRETSLQGHIKFVRSRTEASRAQLGCVAFNEMERLWKWWKEFRQDESAVLHDVSTFLIELLCAKAYDACGVRTTYAETLGDWAGYLARLVRRRSSVAFADFGPMPAAVSGAPWRVVDPVNSDNNIVGSWSQLQCDELADWFEAARDAIPDAIVAFDHDDENAGVAILVGILGTPFEHHSVKK